MKRIVIIVLFLFGFQNSHAQLFELGGELGYGKATFDDQLYFPNLFGKYSENNYKIGILGSFNPNHTLIFFNTGLLYQRKEDHETSLNYFKIPLGLDIEPGKKFKFVFGGGIYLSYLFLTTGAVSHDFTDSKNNCQVGAYADIGFKYQFLNKWNVFVKMKLDCDLTTLYEKSIPNHFEDEEFIKVRSYDYSINIGVNYLISLHKENK